MIPFLLIPGLNCTGAVFAPAARVLWPHGPVVIANPGDGANVADLAERVLDNAPPRFALGGFSMGGYIAFEMWRQAPERIAGLAMIDSMARPDDETERATRAAAIAVAAGGGYMKMVRSGFERLGVPNEAAIEALRIEMAETLGAENYVRHQQAIMDRPDSRPDLAGINVPSVVIVGDRDTVTTPGDAKTIAEGIKNSVLVEIGNAGHWALLEQPEAVNSALVEWAGRLR